MESLQTQFEAAVTHIQQSETDKPLSNTQKLTMYALYKQATLGDVQGSKPSRLDFVKLAKYQAWEKLQGTSMDEAMQQYLTLYHELKAEQENQ